MSIANLDVWVIDPDIWRRGSVSCRLIEMGYMTIPVDPAESIPGTYGRPVIAIIHDDGDIVDRILNCQPKCPISCVVYSDSLKARRASDLLRQGVAALMDWPCHSQDVANAVAAASGGLSARMDDAWSVARARPHIACL
jgi:hypothetical protein